MKIIAAAIILLVATTGRSADEDTSDNWIKEMLVGSNCYIDNPDAAERMFQNARRRCAGDTNRFARLLCEVAQTNDIMIAKDMINSLGVYGTAAQLPFLYSMATNEQHGAAAVKSILRLEGVTSNSLVAVGGCLSMTNVQDRMERENICLFMLDGLANVQTNDEIKSEVERRVLFFAKEFGVYNEHFDGLISRCIPGYKFSKRRLSVLRSAKSNMIIKFNEAFVTNAINELVAYPEADLPE